MGSLFFVYILFYSFFEEQQTTENEIIVFFWENGLFFEDILFIEYFC